ncbi:hypothetical protein SLEP1_g24476 [Rubroshorea leprosula]|uniref:Uncharacterized protein n=1 Tax=Rubroshorea leprosula TaxID=152421 RepID=A0AAV5JG33_9ROSI|nr:hypothetical protein SLEP1_g24476 [Rubroshorea leprosula]
MAKPNHLETTSDALHMTNLHSEQHLLCYVHARHDFIDGIVHGIETGDFFFTFGSTTKWRESQMGNDFQP